jgi:hypothetical protein
MVHGTYHDPESYENVSANMGFHVPLPTDRIYLDNFPPGRDMSIKDAYEREHAAWNAQDPRSWRLLLMPLDINGNYPIQNQTGVALPKYIVNYILRNNPESLPEADAIQQDHQLQVLASAFQFSPGRHSALPARHYFGRLWCMDGICATRSRYSDPIEEVQTG